MPHYYGVAFFMFYIYILYSESYNKYYVGHTNDIRRRLDEHNTNPLMTYTHKFGPWVVAACYEISKTRAVAMKVERYIKRQKSRKIIERLIQDPEYFKELAQLVRVPTCRD